MQNTDREWFDELIKTATSKVAEGFFLISEFQGIQRYRERVYCYELYHQLRTLWTSQSFVLHGELDKAGHPAFGPYGPEPDLLIHRPGSMDNYAAIEVKSCMASNDGIKKDLKTLARLHEFGYERCIYLVYGSSANECSRRVQELRSVGSSIEVWLHDTPGESCYCKSGTLEL